MAKKYKVNRSTKKWAGIDQQVDVTSYEMEYRKAHEHTAGFYPLLAIGELFTKQLKEKGVLRPHA